MEQLANLPVGRLLDPAVLVPALGVSAALASGLAARVIEFWEHHRPG